MLENGAIKDRALGRFTGAFLASFLLLAASLANYLVYDKYPLFRVEVAAAAFWLALACTLFSFLYRFTGLWTRRILDTLLIALVADINMENTIWPMVAGGGYFVVSLFLKEAPHKLFATFGGFVLVTSLLGLGQSQPWITEKKSTAAARPAQAGRPAIVHILLDEHIGIEGFHKTQSGTETAAKLREFYVDNGFALYGKAYSQHMHTVNAIPHVLNFGAEKNLGAGRHGVPVGRNAYFDRLQKLGYRMSIYESNFAYVCSSYPDERCVAYRNSSLQPMANYGLTTGERMKMILSKFIGMSHTLEYAGRKSEILDRILVVSGLPGFRAFQNLKATGPVASMAVFDVVANDLANARSGEAYFVHALFPHYPYTSASDCSSKPIATWNHRLDRGPMEQKQNGYEEQALCSARQIEKLLDVLKQSPAADNFVMIVHGDHGSRLTQVDPSYERRASIRPDDIIASYSTLFAVRIGGMPGRYSDAMVNTPRLLKALSDNQFSAAPEPLTDSQPYIFIDDDDWTPRAKVPMPSQW